MQRPKNPPRGTYDLLPEQSIHWQHIESIAQQCFQAAGFGEIRTPIFESTDIFIRSVGESSDIANKELYSFEDRSGRNISLRPEGTAGTVRAYLSNGLDRKPKPVKLWYGGPMFRYERSQTGRYRQFKQIGIEAFGSVGPEIELECLILALDFFERLGLKIGEHLEVEINCLGDFESRKNYQEAMAKFLTEHKDKICADCQIRMETNPLRALDCKVPADQELYQAHAPNIQEYLNESSLAHRDKLFELLDNLGIQYKYTTGLVRGLDYYTQTVFEIKAKTPNLGQQNTICAGGRYNQLVSDFGGDETPAFGWALGQERLMSILDEFGLLNKETNNIDFFVVDEANNFSQAFDLARKVRAQDCTVSLDYDQKKAKKQFDLAQKSGAAKAIIIRENQEIIVKDLQDYSNQETFSSIDSLLEALS